MRCSDAVRNDAPYAHQCSECKLICQLSLQLSYSLVVRLYRRDDMDLENWLGENGWREYTASAMETATRNWKKRIECPFVGVLNNTLAVHLLEYDLRKIAPGLCFKYEVRIYAQLVDGTWVKLTSHGLIRAQLQKTLDDQVDRLVKGWVAMNS